ncbi:MAG: nicotinate (nicotinamide) nucleotide adenylyltransferase [Magnetococcales bacterium]|nr:nicotinate (nicotinamide) nucleotide adenylyltransferase [Magnetococcales bacterium]
MPRRTGLLGGTFDPLHYGHLRPAREAMGLLHLERVVLIPSGVHPFKGEGKRFSAEDRLRQIEAVLTGWPGFSVWDHEVRKVGYSYTIETLTARRAAFPDEEHVLLMGADLLRELHLWRAWERIIDLAHIAIMPRPGFAIREEDAPALAVLNEKRVGGPENLVFARSGRFGFCVLPLGELQEISSSELRTGAKNPQEWCPSGIAEQMRSNQIGEKQSGRRSPGQ